MNGSDGRTPRLTGLVLGDDAPAWRRAGFDVRDQGFATGGVSFHLAGQVAGHGVVGWHLEPPASEALDGLEPADVAPRASEGAHPNGVVALDHVVVATDDLDRTTAALATVDIRPRRTVVGAQGDDATAFRFFLLGTCVLELIGPAEPDPGAEAGAAAFVGLAFTTTTVDDLGDLAPPPRPAVQPGRRITTLDHAALGLSVPVALLSPRPGTIRLTPPSSAPGQDPGAPAANSSTTTRRRRRALGRETTMTFAAARPTVRPLHALLALVVAAALLPLGTGHAAAQAAEHSKTDAVVTGAEGTDIAISIYRPAGASAADPAPVILHSHGWGGSRTSSDDAFTRELDRGFAVVSIDQRGFGESGGQAHIQDPELEGRDILAVIDHIAALDWVLKDRDDAGAEIANDPVLFAMGGSYGGAYQLVAALTEVRDTAGFDDDGELVEPGHTRFNALAPDMTWFDLTRSLAPENVVRTAWVSLLYAVGIPTLPQHVHEGFVYGASTGQWPDGTAPGIANLEEILFANGPSGFVADGHQLDIPTLLTQGFSDNLFNGNEGWHNFERTLTPEAREQSLFIGYNGGHALPNLLPAGVAGSDNACEDDVAGLRLDFFAAAMNGENPRELKDATYSVSTVGDTCVELETLTDTTPVEAGDLSISGRSVTTTGLGLPQQRELISGPATVAGIPHLRADVTSAGADQRVFFGLSVGTSPLDAQIVQNNMMPLRELLPVVGEPRTVELPAVAVELEEGESLYLTMSPVSDMSFGHGSIRTPGLVMLEDVVVDVPVVTEDDTEPTDPGDPSDCRPGNSSDRAADRSRACPPGQDRD